MTGAPGSLVLVRHGESAANALGLFTGVLDVGLTPRGERSCHDAAARLHATGWRPDLVLASVLTRSWHTADIVAGAVGGEVVRDWRLGERSYGALTGFGKREVAERHGQELFVHWRRSLDGRPEPLPERTVALWRSLPPFAGLPAEALAPTESLADVVERVRPLWEGTLGDALRAGRHVLVVAHGNSLRALCALVDDLSPAELRELNLPNARPLLYELAPGLVPRVRGGRYLDPRLAAAEAAAIAAQGGT
ncbi:2,3-bisphosphoglycerate-dependent phosphoglycerate mutase [Georgenia satyanarayanai]|uniref:2,3-bisphosphoglycerate-dependent phosphoglycerate mutase n=1 Tax=Georgenia satyanarayanai TaxID=860221 RepID=UPI001264AEB5|nr:2,3-diphosphoglycerate-dependent phosphoglycerate mutase [Georgenia satyanarayanai]